MAEVASSMSIASSILLRSYCIRWLHLGRLYSTVNRGGELFFVGLERIQSRAAVICLQQWFAIEKARWLEEPAA